MAVPQKFRQLGEFYRCAFRCHCLILLLAWAAFVTSRSSMCTPHLAISSISEHLALQILHRGIGSTNSNHRNRRKS